MKHKLLRTTCAAVMMLLCMTALGAGGGGTSNKIVVVSDIHVMAPDLLENGAETQDAWLTYYSGQRKMLQQSAAIFEQFISQMTTLRPKVVLIAGDLTKDGEQLSHEYVRNCLYNLRYYGITVLVIPGNHDFGAEGNNTIFRADGTTEPADVLTIDDFKDYYDGFGYYDSDSEYDPNSLSYVAEPMEGLVVLAIDSHTASISEATLEWLCTKAKNARNTGKQVIAMMHHPLFPHITGANLFIDTYTVSSYETVRNALIDAGVNTILTGHFHTSDIAKDWNDDENKAVYDINTGSLISYPCDYRILTPSSDFMSLSVETASIVPTGMSAADCKTWLQGRAKSLAIEKMKAKAGAAAAAFAEQINNLGEFLANLFILHAEGNEADSGDRAGLATTYTTYKGDATYSMLLTAGGITDASIYSILDDKSNYGTDKENVTNDRTLSITLPEVGPFIPAEPGVVTVGKDQYSTEVPLSASHAWVLSKQLYTAKEINHKGKIWSIAFNTTKGNLSRNLTVYMTQTSNSSTSWDAVTKDDCVFSGEVLFTAGQWTTIYFDKPFEYDGKSNIVVTVDDNTGKKDGSWGVLSHYIFYGDAGVAYAYDDTKDIDPTDEESIDNASNRGTYTYKNEIKFTFGEYPLPSNPNVSEIGDKSAKVSCTLRGDATGWNVRYRKVAGEGEEEQEWTIVSGISESSKVISGLTANTKYEAQVQGIFAKDDVSDWTESVIFVTACCPVEHQGEIIYALSSYGRLWYDFAVQIMDVTDKDNPIEVAYLRAPDSDTYGGTLTLCCGHKYKVNWIYDEENASNNKWYSFSLFFEPGDLFYSMARGEAPNKTAELTEFIMDCTPYCAQKPKNFTVASTTYSSATLNFVSETREGEVVYSTMKDFDPDATTPTSVTFDEIINDNEFDYNPANSSVTIKGLESLTEYYVRVRSLCTEGEGGTSRWSDPVKVTTGSVYDAPGQVIATGVDSRTEHLSWERNGGEKKSNLYYRVRVPGNSVDASSLVTFGNVKATGEEGFEFDEKTTWSSYGYGQNPFSNVLYYPGIPAGSSFSFNAANWNSKGGLVQFLWGFKKSNGKTAQAMMEAFDMECLNDADRAARIKELKDKIASSTDETEIAKWNADIEILEALPTDADKLARMKELESLIKNSTNETERAKYSAELNNLRAIMSVADNGKGSGFSVSRDQSPASSRSFRAPELGDGTFTFFIRHANDDGYLAARDFTITPVEDLNEWIVIPNISGTEYTLTGLTPNTEYEVMVEPVYDDNTKGTQSAITIFTTLTEETDPLESKFSVSATKKVQFAKGNLRFEGDTYGMEATWSMAPQQYDIFGERNVEATGENSYPASPRDLFCWSNANTRYGIYNYYRDSPEETQQYFHDDFTDWGTNAKLTAALGAGWSTLDKDEWTYLLNERENADKLKSLATITYVKEKEEVSVPGLILLPDDWTAETPAGTFTAEEWATLEDDGAVFLPTAGVMVAVYNPDTWGATTTYIPNAIYWTSSPVDEAAGDPNDFGSGLTFNDSEVKITNVARRAYTAVRLVKAVDMMGDADGDGVVDVNDVTSTINYILNKPVAKFFLKNADMDKDGKIDVNDVQAIIYKALGK